MSERLYNNYVFPAILFIVVFLLFGIDLFSSGVFGSIYTDTDLNYYINLREYAYHQNRYFPKWNILDMCGVPLLGEIQSAVFYPLNLIFLFLPLPTAINISIFIHLYLLSIFTYFFCRQIKISEYGALIAAVVITFCGPVVLRIFAGHLSNLSTIIWIPLSLLIIVRIAEQPCSRYLVMLGLIFAFQFLAGHPQYLFYSLLFSAGFFFFKSSYLLKNHEFKKWFFSCLGFGFSSLLGLLLVLPQLIPLLEILSLSSRTALSYQDISGFSFPLENLTTIFIPTIFGDMIKVKYWGVYNLWEMNIYCGIMPLLLAILAIFKIKKNQQYVYFFLFSAIITLLIGFGDNTPILKVLYSFFPGFGLFRGHSKIVIIFCFCVAILAGIGFDSLANLKREKNRTFNIQLVLFVLAFFLMIFFVKYSGLFEDMIKFMLNTAEVDPRRYLPVPGSNNIKFVQPLILLAKTSSMVFFILLFVSGLLIFLVKLFGFNKLLQTSIVLFIYIDMFIFATRFVFTVDPAFWNLKREVKQFFQKDKTLFRTAILTSRGNKYGSYSSLQRVTGDYPYVLKRYSKFYNLASTGKHGESMKLGPLREISPVFNILNLKYLMLDSGIEIPFKEYKKVYDDGEFVIFENKKALERVYISHSVKIARHENLALRYLFEPETISGKQIILEKDIRADMKKELKTQATNQNITETSHIMEYKPDMVKIDVNMAQNGWVCLLDTFYPGWKATIDNSINTEIFKANYLFRAVYVPKGKHEITFRYIPSYYFISKLVSLIVFVLIVIYFIVSSNWRRKFIKTAPEYPFRV